MVCCDATMVQCNNGAMHKDHNASMVMLHRNNMRVVFKHGGNNVAPQQYGHAGARCWGIGGSNVATHNKHSPNIPKKLSANMTIQSKGF
jgi:hypothetical protein